MSRAAALLRLGPRDHFSFSSINTSQWICYAITKYRLGITSLRERGPIEIGDKSELYWRTPGDLDRHANGESMTAR